MFSLGVILSGAAAPLRVTRSGSLSPCHPELVEGSLYEYRHYYHRDPSTPLRSAQDDGKEARRSAQDDVRYFLSNNQIALAKITLFASALNLP